ncbi:MAG: membrane protein insertase YidC [Elusimicrobia bacterium]|nr:membrane protein insertase YidC [Elusimicrobiota bacterium]
MQKNLVLAVVLSSLVYIGWYSFMEKKLQPRKDQAARQQTAAPGTPSAAAAPSASPAQAPAALPVSAELKKETVSIKAGKAEYVFYSGAAAMKSAVYQGPVAPVELIPGQETGFFASSLPGVFRLRSRTADSLEFEASPRPGLLLTKKFIFSPDNSLNSVSVTASNNSSQAQLLPAWELSLGPGLGTVKSEEKENPKLWKAVYTYREEGRKHPTLKDLKDLKDDPAKADWVWAGLENRYFLAAVTGDGLSGVRPLRRETLVKDEKAPLLALSVPAAELKAGEKRAWETRFYIGPKDYARLQALGHGLDRSVDFGFFAPLAKLANSSIVYFYKLTGNYGAAIIILSVIIQIILTPLSFKSFKAMAVMKKIQPEMQAIQKKYKEDPKRMNAEVMDLYKRHGTNPLGGCLPMLLQIPVFFALFTALRESWALHGAPFVFWIKDLSAKDPFYVLPIVMGGIMFLQQHLSPQTSDPSQAAMMKWMPVIFTFMFLTFPSGLVLYWLVNSTWGFAQTMYLQKTSA